MKQRITFGIVFLISVQVARLIWRPLFLELLSHTTVVGDPEQFANIYAITSTAVILLSATIIAYGATKLIGRP
jgi:hypothetical protein